VVFWGVSVAAARHFAARKMTGGGDSAVQLQRCGGSAATLLQHRCGVVISTPNQTFSIFPRGYNG
jgi:hypothetical protein